MNTLRNKVQLIGNLGNNPEIITLESGKKLAKFSIATNETYKNAKGEKTTLTEGRIKLLDDIGFPWVHANPTPKKTIIPPAGVQSVHNMLVESRVVSPAEAAESTSTQVSELCKSCSCGRRKYLEVSPYEM